MDMALVGSAFAGLLVGGGGVATVVGVWAVNGRRPADDNAFGPDPQIAAREAARAEALLAEQAAALTEARERAAVLEGRAARKAERAAELETEVARVREAANGLDERVRAAEKRLANAEQSRDNAKRELAAALAHSSRVDRSLVSLGVVLPDRPWSPTAAERRAASRDALRALVVDTGASAVALVDRAGLVAFAVGPDELVARLGVAGALFAAVEPALGVLLCAPVKELSTTNRRGATHLYAVPGTQWLLAVENQGVAPRHAVALALLALFGRPEPSDSVVEMPANVPESSRSPDPEVTRILHAWGTRWAVEQAGLLDAVGQVIGSTDPGSAGPMYGVRRALGPLFARLGRDGWPLDDVEIRAGSQDLRVAIRPIDSDLESPVLVATSAQLPETWALDELAATMRWHLALAGAMGADRRIG